jgi:hypothetical protein
MSRAQDLFDRLIAGGAAEVLSFIAQSVTEELFLDYKRSADNGAGNALHNKDRSNLAKAISGFGNSEGGVILWGVDCRNDPAVGDVPTGPIHIQNPTRFKSWLEQVTTGLTVPPHGGVRHHAIPEGFVVTLIPNGLHAPYQTVGELSYYIRAGSNFAKTPHAVLAGLFGRRPQPSIRHHYFVPTSPSIIGLGMVKAQIGIMLRNYGLGIAEDVFINLSITNHPGPRCQIEFKPSEEHEVWRGNLLINQHMQLITRAGIRLPPEADLMPLALDVTLQHPIEGSFSFEGICGSSGGETSRFQFKSDAADIIEAYEQFVMNSDKYAGTPLAKANDENITAIFNRKFFKCISNS